MGWVGNMIGGLGGSEREWRCHIVFSFSPPGVKREFQDETFDCSFRHALKVGFENCPGAQ